MARKRITRIVLKHEKINAIGNTKVKYVKDNSPSLDKEIENRRNKRQKKYTSTWARIQADMQKLKGDNQ